MFDVFLAIATISSSQGDELAPTYENTVRCAGLARLVEDAFREFNENDVGDYEAFHGALMTLQRKAGELGAEVGIAGPIVAREIESRRDAERAASRGGHFPRQDFLKCLSLASRL
ncbi:hypothetical protein [Brevundimonas subvibrioides]|uniref:hypothetical protein n=1 Tax=Brevundimonas subvibrioides TaxID=74313 RepID=UPI0022B371AF|nr:hypothetical protein [Brevundimonas subvibrioides]